LALKLLFNKSDSLIKITDKAKPRAIVGGNELDFEGRGLAL